MQEVNEEEFSALEVGRSEIGESVVNIADSAPSTNTSTHIPVAGSITQPSAQTKKRLAKMVSAEDMNLLLLSGHAPTAAALAVVVAVVVAVSWTSRARGERCCAEIAKKVSLLELYAKK